MKAISRQPDTEAAAKYQLSDADSKLLDEVQHAAFLYFWREVGATGLAKDRQKAPVASIASIGFQLSALPIGVERGWISRDEGRDRAARVLRTLIERDDNKKFGLYFHYPDLNTGGQSRAGFETVVSTVDSALLFAGAATAGEFFGGEVQSLAGRMLDDADWRPFCTGPKGEISLGWEPVDPKRPTGDGKFISQCWTVAADEERLVYFLAIGAAPDHAAAPKLYYELARPVKRHADMPPFVVTWQGTLFHYFFSHCWIDYRSLGVDNPAAFGSDVVPVDWFENSRRAVLTHRRRCLEQRERFKTFAEDRWGLSACVGRDGYLVPEVQPNIIDQDQWHEGTVAPYAAGSAIMFTPAESLAALRAFRDLKDEKGKPFVWRDPSEGGYGFVDAFNLDQKFACDDYVGIDHGPMLLAIENVRTGLIWRLFMKSEVARRGLERLKLAR